MKYVERQVKKANALHRKISAPLKEEKQLSVDDTSLCDLMAKE